MHAALGHGEGRAGSVDAGRHHLDLHPVEFALVDGQLVGEVDIAIHHPGHEFDRVVRLQPRSLIADHRIGRRMRFVEAVIGEFFQKIKNFSGLLRIDAIRDRAIDEFRPLLGHFLGDLLAHGAAQQVGTAERIARHDLRDLHHLFLIDDDALRFGKDMVDGRVNGFKVFLAVLHLAIGGNVLHRAGPIKRHERHDILDAGRLHPPERIHHARAFHLEDGDGAGAGKKLVTGRIVQRDRVDLVQRPLGRVVKLAAVGGDMQGPAAAIDQIDRVLNDGQGLQAEEVELHQPGLLHPFHVELRGRHVGCRIAVERHQPVQRPVPDHHAGGMGRGVAVKPLHLGGVIQQPGHHFLAVAGLSQARFVRDGLGHADRLHTLDRDHF